MVTLVTDNIGIMLYNRAIKENERMCYKMVEKKYTFQITDKKLIEKVIDDEHVNINHMVLPTGDSLPQHYSNSNVYMTVVRGRVTLELDDQPAHVYEAGSIINIPYNTHMNVFNQHEETLEFFVIKAPSPRNYHKYVKE